jgi:hypothetical protein
MLTPDDLTTLRGARLDAAETDERGGLRLSLSMSRGGQAVVLLIAEGSGVSMIDESGS